MHCPNSSCSCGKVGVAPGCRLVEDLTLDYPSCCPRQVCDQALPRRRLDEVYYDYYLGDYDEQTEDGFSTIQLKESHKDRADSILRPLWFNNLLPK